MNLHPRTKASLKKVSWIQIKKIVDWGSLFRMYDALQKNSKQDKQNTIVRNIDVYMLQLLESLVNLPSARSTDNTTDVVSFSPQQPSLYVLFMVPHCEDTFEVYETFEVNPSKMDEATGIKALL